MVNYTGNIELTDNKYLDDIIKYKQDETFENAKEVLGVLYYKSLFGIMYKDSLKRRR